MKDYLKLIQDCCVKYHPDCRSCPFWLKDNNMNSQFGLECDGGVYSKIPENFDIAGIKAVLDEEFGE